MGSQQRRSWGTLEQGYPCIKPRSGGVGALWGAVAGMALNSKHAGRFGPACPSVRPFYGPASLGDITLDFKGVSTALRPPRAVSRHHGGGCKRCSSPGESRQEFTVYRYRHGGGVEPWHRVQAPPDPLFPQQNSPKPPSLSAEEGGQSLGSGC